MKKLLVTALVLIPVAAFAQDAAPAVSDVCAAESIDPNSLIGLLGPKAANIVLGVTSIVAGASYLANLTPTDADNKALGKVSALIHFLAGNFKSGSLKGPKE